jgi:hypothetical protein
MISFLLHTLRRDECFTYRGQLGTYVPPEPAPPLILAVLLQAPLAPLIGAVKVVEMFALLAACTHLTSSALVSVEQERSHLINGAVGVDGPHLLLPFRELVDRSTGGRHFYFGEGYVSG